MMVRGKTPPKPARSPESAPALGLSPSLRRHLVDLLDGRPSRVSLLCRRRAIELGYVDPITKELTGEGRALIERYMTPTPEIAARTRFWDGVTGR